MTPSPSPSSPPSDPQHAAPPVAEEIHLPGPSLLPILMAFGITLFVVGTTMSPFVLIAGAVIFLITLYRWVRGAREEFDELPADHAPEH